MAYCFNNDKSKVSILDAIYPVGSIYMSVNSTSPAQLFGGGTWEQIKGRFLVAQGNNGQSGNAALNLSAGATGGETNHQLTVSEMPSHEHKYRLNGGTNTQTANAAINGSGAVNGYVAIGEGGVGYKVPVGSGLVAWGDSTQTTTIGGGNGHNNLPPYLSVYMWKRTA